MNAFHLAWNIIRPKVIDCEFILRVIVQREYFETVDDRKVSVELFLICRSIGLLNVLTLIQPKMMFFVKLLSLFLVTHIVKTEVFFEERFPDGKILSINPTRSAKGLRVNSFDIRSSTIFTTWRQRFTRIEITTLSRRLHT